MGVYTKTTWSTGDVITQTKIQNLETQHEKILLLDNAQFITGKDSSGNAINLIGMKATTANMLIGEGGVNLNDVIVQAPGTLTKKGASINEAHLGVVRTNVFAQILNTIEAKGSFDAATLDAPGMIIDQTGTAQFSGLAFYDAGIHKGGVFYDQTNNRVVFLDASENVRFSIDLDDGEIYSQNFPGARGHRTGAQTITTATLTAFSMQTEDYDTDAMIDIGTNPTRITSNKTAKYLITANLVFTGNTTGERQASFRIDGLTTLALERKQNLGSVETTLNLAAVMEIAKASYIELMVYQDSGGNLDIVRNADSSPYFGAQMMDN